MMEKNQNQTKETEIVQQMITQSKWKFLQQDNQLIMISENIIGKHTAENIDRIGMDQRKQKTRRRKMG